jgi:hypothetical protein
MDDILYKVAAEALPFIHEQERFHPDPDGNF